jgi:lysozyme family protein
MDKENNLVPSFFFSINEYLYIFGINSILTLNDFINTQSPDKISSITLLRIFSYGMFEYQKSIINSPDIAFNIISKILKYTSKKNVKEDKTKIDKIYRLCLNAKNIEDYDNITNYIEES